MVLLVVPWQLSERFSLYKIRPTIRSLSTGTTEWAHLLLMATAWCRSIFFFLQKFYQCCGVVNVGFGDSGSWLIIPHAGILQLLSHSLYLSWRFLSYMLTFASLQKKTIVQHLTHASEYKNLLGFFEFSAAPVKPNLTKRKQLKQLRHNSKPTRSESSRFCTWCKYAIAAAVCC